MTLYKKNGVLEKENNSDINQKGKSNYLA